MECLSAAFCPICTTKEDFAADELYFNAMSRLPFLSDALQEFNDTNVPGPGLRTL